MAANPTKPSTETFSGPREHQSFRLEPGVISLIEDIAKGVQEGDAGLKSCAIAGLNAAVAGAKASAIVDTHERSIAEIEDEDECFNAMGDLLAKGFSHEEIRKRVRLAGGSTNLLALERWCDREKVMCDPDAMPIVWEGSALHERRGRARRAMTLLRGSADGTAHAAVLHIVYGWPDPMLFAVRSFRSECRRIEKAREAKETTEEVPTLHPADRAVFGLAEALLDELGGELAPLARYTDRVEAKRLELARSAARAASTRVYVPASQRPENRSTGGECLIGLREAIAHAGESMEMFRLATNHAAVGAPRREKLTHEEGMRLINLERARVVLHHSEQSLTSTDALRAGFAHFDEPPLVQAEGESVASFESRKDGRKARKTAHAAARSSFITDVKIEANRMLTEASVAFREAWKAS